ncbi:MAG: CpaF family protein [Inquilinaceae bacterium]
MFGGRNPGKGPQGPRRPLTGGPRGPAERGGAGDAAATMIDSERMDKLRATLQPHVLQMINPDVAKRLPRKDVAGQVSDIVVNILDQIGETPDLLEQRQLVTALVNDVLSAEPASSFPVGIGVLADAAPRPDPPARSASGSGLSLDEVKRRVRPLLLERIDIGAAARLAHGDLVRELNSVAAEIRDELHLQLNQSEHDALVTALVDDMIGLGPLEPLLADADVTDIMVNGPNQVYVERRGKLELTSVKFQDNAHVMSIATRIVTRVGRRIDESNPICDARLADGSRVNVIAPPLAIDGASISIRKFAKQKITLDRMTEQQNLSPQMTTLLKIASRSRLNVLISGGTGSGKTTLLNALSQVIDPGDRIVTIEDAAELQLQQPHVVRLETRPANLEGKGEISMRQLLKNALRMRPDRIILGEVRGAEAFDMLQAMNTGHEGSMCTLHANKPREALSRLENMIGMASINLPTRALRTQIASAVDLIVQVSRMRDGIRRITSIVEVVGMEGDVIVTQDLFSFEYEGEDARGRLIGTFRPAGVRPHFMPRADYYGLGQALLEVC